MLDAPFLWIQISKIQVATYGWAYTISFSFVGCVIPVIVLLAGDLYPLRVFIYYAVTVALSSMSCTSMGSSQSSGYCLKAFETVNIIYEM